MVKAIGQHFLIYCGRPTFGHTIKTNCVTYLAVDPELFSILIFYKKSFELGSPPDFVLRKLFLMLYSSN